MSGKYVYIPVIQSLEGEISNQTVYTNPWVALDGLCNFVYDEYSIRLTPGSFSYNFGSHQYFYRNEGQPEFKAFVDRKVKRHGNEKTQQTVRRKKWQKEHD